VRLLEPGIESGTSLVAQIRKQPFSVVLFDEIEKAHPDVVNILLQLLDEGVLRDSTNREVSFRDAIVIATSNAGADRIRQYIQAGYQLDQFEDQFVNELIDSNQFKPEFLNRFDEIVLFRPLNKEELLQVVDLMVAAINKTLMRQKVQVSLTQEAKVWLVDQGYDARLGARPLRRMVQRSVENIVAKKLLSEDFRPGTTLQLDAHDLELIQG
jgi:ATP-dependent Clp protease ATP-binding subunit ClpA